MSKGTIIYQLENAFEQRLEEQGPAAYAIVGSAIAVAAYKMYKRIFDPARRACAGEEDRADCIKRYKIRALLAQKKYILSGKPRCKDADCYSYLDNEIDKIESKIDKLRG